MILKSMISFQLVQVFPFLDSAKLQQKKLVSKIFFHKYGAYFSCLFQLQAKEDNICIILVKTCTEKITNSMFNNESSCFIQLPDFSNLSVMS